MGRHQMHLRGEEIHGGAPEVHLREHPSLHVFLVVIPDVGVEVGGLSERAVAQMAVERLLLTVQPHVVAEIPRLGEGAIADRAPVRPAPGVDPHVMHQVAGLREALVAYLADVRLEAGVRSRVHGEVAEILKHFVAVRAAIGPFGVASGRVMGLQMRGYSLVMLLANGALLKGTRIPGTCRSPSDRQKILF